MMAATAMPAGMSLRKLLAGFVPDLPELGTATEVVVEALTLDSRRVGPGSLFLAVAGSAGHGGAYLEQALAAGAAAVAVERGGTMEWRIVEGRRVPVIPVDRLRVRAGEIAARFYGDPSAAMTVVGVTGTNGKSSVAHFLAQLLAVDGPCGLVGTLGSGLYGALRATGHTTPDPVTLQAELAAQHEAGARATVMEVSSHALHQGRVAGVAFDIAVFTNLSHDHLDYHGDMAAYAEAKRRLFAQPGLTGGVINLDDPVGRGWYDALGGKVRRIGYTLGGAKAQGEVIRGEIRGLGAEGMQLAVHSPWGEGEATVPLLGRFNAANVLAVVGAAVAAGIPFDSVLARLAVLQTVPGRMERFGGGERPLVVVDYAHTPDALEQALAALREHCIGRLWCVFGCGGDRDRAKRPVMGAVAERLADHLVLTDDNPRHENPLDIIEQIQRGMTHPDAAYVIRDRSEAIGHVVALAAAGDVVLVAGKGHEAEQVVGDRKLPFSDREAVRRALEEVSGG